jgi:exonuclease SbcD
VATQAEAARTAIPDGDRTIAVTHIFAQGGELADSEQVQYAGSLMKYSFDEVHHEKSIHLVKMDAEGRCEIEQIPLTPERDLRRV